MSLSSGNLDHELSQHHSEPNQCQHQQNPTSTSVDTHGYTTSQGYHVYSSIEGAETISVAQATVDYNTQLQLVNPQLDYSQQSNSTTSPAAYYNRPSLAINNYASPSYSIDYSGLQRTAAMTPEHRQYTYEASQYIQPPSYTTHQMGMNPSVNQTYTQYQGTAYNRLGATSTSQTYQPMSSYSNIGRVRTDGSVQRRNQADYVGTPGYVSQVQHISPADHIQQQYAACSLPQQQQWIQNNLQEAPVSQNQYRQPVNWQANNYQQQATRTYPVQFTSPPTTSTVAQVSESKLPSSVKTSELTKTSGLAATAGPAKTANTGGLPAGPYFYEA
jgi:hypothetical protein